MHATVAGSLTVGTDLSIQHESFDGTFSDGAAASFGLTKVGNGTLTLTAVSTNTGAVTVNGGTIAMTSSGSFNKASQIIANNGGIYDVTGAGGTLTLNSGQTLRGNGGTVNGILLASAGSAVAPGFPMGTLTISGNGTVNGIYRPNLNRTNSPSNCSKFTSSGGSITFSGATLSVTNVGLKLQVGDRLPAILRCDDLLSFSITIALQTNDVLIQCKIYLREQHRFNRRSWAMVASVSEIVNSTPTNIVSKVNGSNLELSWPADHTGWTLQVQTNTTSVGIQHAPTGCRCRDQLWSTV